ncbi:MAG: hypothetical protein LBR66_09385, partial [Candidatus Symbiothrix sp.]|nr:hypothetical protein [Candidatus Symbiothrix sp.]
MKTFRILLAVVCLLASMTTMSQITVGTRQEAHRGALLHLRTTTQDVPRETYDTLGLKLTVVDLPDTSKLYLGDALTYGLDVDKTATGMVVYNRTNDPCSALVPCLYVWDGATWHPAGCPVPECATPLSATYQIDGCVALMYTYQTQKLWVSPTTSVDYGKQKQYKWRERVRINNGAWGAWTTLSTTDSVHVIPPFRFNSPTYSTSDLIEAQYECEVKNAASPAITATLYGGTATITFVHLGTSAEIHAKAAANAGLIPVKLKTGSGASDTLIIAHANLGAELDSINDGITNDACDFGDLYQWGRQKDGHQRVTWRKNSVNEIDIYNPPSPLSSALYNQGTPLIAGDYGVDHQVLNTSAAFGKFIYSSAEVKWTLTAADSEDLWRGDIKTSSDPCPAGWRVMNRDEITKLYNSAPGIQLPWGSASIDTNNTWKQSDANSFTKNWGGGYIVRNNSASDQYAIFVTAGVRDRSTGLIGTAFSDVEGRLWTSSDEEGTSSAASNNLYAHSFAFNKTFFRTDDVNSGGSQFNKVDGRGVRCVKLAESDLCYDSNTTGTEFYVAFGKNHNADNDPTTPNSGLFGDPYLAVDVSAKVNTNVTFTFTYDDSTVVQTVNAGSVY